MMAKFDIDFTQSAADNVRIYRKFDQQIILDGIEQQLRFEPTKGTSKRKRLGDNELSDWELRIGKFRVFYNVESDDRGQFVKVTAVGHKEHNKLFIGSREVQL